MFYYVCVEIGYVKHAEVFFRGQGNLYFYAYHGFDYDIYPDAVKCSCDGTLTVTNYLDVSRQKLFYFRDETVHYATRVV